MAGPHPLLLYPLALAYAGFGVVHLATPGVLMPLMPPWVPFPREVILATGACEIAGAVGLLVHRLRPLAAVMLGLYALCVWPANIHHALSGAHVRHIPDSWWYHGPRLVLQPVLIWLPLYAAGLTAWPFARRLWSGSRAGPPAPAVGRRSVNLAVVLATALSAASPDPAAPVAEQGRVMLKCTLHADGTLDPCEVESETPSGVGLGTRALELAKRSHIYRAKGPGVVRVPMVFQLIEEAYSAPVAADNGR